MPSFRLLPLALALVACGPAADPEGADSDDTDAGRDSAPVAPDDALGFVLADFGFAYPPAGGATPGIDLDGRSSTAAAPDAAECAHDDFAEGVDFQLLRVIEEVGEGMLEGQIIDGVIEAAVKNGSFTVVFELTGVDDPRNDDSVTVQLHDSEDVPPLGSNEVLAGGTLTIGQAVSTPAVTTALVDGRLRAGPFTFAMPLEIQLVSATLTLTDAWLELELGADDTATGLVMGSWAVQDLIDILGTPTQENSDNASDPSKPGAAGFALDDFEASLARHADGGKGAAGCSTISSVFRIDARQAFLVR